MMIESRALDQRGLCPQVKNFLGRITLVVIDAQGVRRTGVRAFLRVPLDIRYQLGD
jgi:hypothetical protein